MSETLHFAGAEDNALAADLWRPHGAADGPVVMLMHGGGQTRHSWTATAQRMQAAGITAIAVDARGHGDSDWVASRAYGFPRMAADLHAVAREVMRRFGRPILVGASMGGLAGMYACRDVPDLFRAMVFVDITPRMEPSGVDKIMSFMAARAADGFGSVEEAADTIAAYMPNRKRPTSLSGLSKNLRLREDGRWYWHWDPAFVSGPEPITDGGEVRGEGLFAEGLSRATVPILLVRGSRSELVSEAAVAAFMRVAPHARFVDVTGAGHMVAGDRNDVFADAVIDFVREVAQEPVNEGERFSAKARSPSA